MKILLHCCCAPCASACIERLRSENEDITLFYDNPNIYPESERIKRLEWLKFLADKYSLDVIVRHTEHEKWLDYISGFEDEPEGGERCKKCFEFNLILAQKYIDSHKGEYKGFSTSLSVSRFKNSQKIFSAASGCSDFLAYDFKKKSGFERSCKLSEELGLYRQKYCGCEFSLKNFEN